MESDPSNNQQEQRRILLSGNTDGAAAEAEAAAKADHGEQDAELDLDADVAFDVIEGEEVKVEKKRRKVRFNDCSLTQVLEFQPSSRDDAISLCAQLCAWFCGQRAVNDR